MSQVKCKASVYTFTEQTDPQVYEGDGGGSSMDGSCWLMIVNERPSVLIPFSNIERIEYEYFDEEEDDGPKLEYTH